MRMKNNGFTLIDLSIVLVIIGLIAGGVLVGKDLIAATEHRATIRQAEQIDRAVNAFRSKFNCLPGDCVNADQFGFSHNQGAGISGNGDGRIQYYTFDGVGNEYFESATMLIHLTEANLLAG